MHAPDASASHTLDGCLCRSADCPCPAHRPRTTWKGAPGDIARAAKVIEQAGVPAWDLRHEPLLLERLPYPAKVHRLLSRRPPDFREQIEAATTSLTVIRRKRKLGLTDGHAVWWPNATALDEPALRLAFAHHRGTWE